MKITKNMYVENTDASRELELYAENDNNIYFQHLQPVIKNLKKKLSRVFLMRKRLLWPFTM